MPYIVEVTGKLTNEMTIKFLTKTPKKDRYELTAIKNKAWEFKTLRSASAAFNSYKNDCGGMSLTYLRSLTAKFLEL